MNKDVVFSATYTITETWELSSDTVSAALITNGYDTLAPEYVSIQDCLVKGKTGLWEVSDSKRDKFIETVRRAGAYAIMRYLKNKKIAPQDSIQTGKGEYDITIDGVTGAVPLDLLFILAGHWNDFCPDKPDFTQLREVWRGNPPKEGE